ncbi:MAG: hypothetical protein WBA77_17390 [Microcoleaceae cyanobacterium]
MKNQLTKALSDPSRTNQLKILDNSEYIAEKLFQYLLKAGRGIEYFELKYYPNKNDNSEDEASEEDNSSYYIRRHRYIKQQIKERLSEKGRDVEYSKIGYFLSRSNGKTYVFFLSSNKKDSRWTKIFKDNREIIFNLVFKFYLLKQTLLNEQIDTINGFEELLLIHSQKLSKKPKEALYVWGLNLLIRYNQYNVLTLNLTRKHQRFLKTGYSIADGDDMGELLIHKEKNYYFDRNLDARRKNDISFMNFPDKKNEKDYKKFKETQLYHYQNLMTKLEDFLRECDIAFEPLHFKAYHYLENPFITNIESVESLEIINNTGVDLTESEQHFLTNFLKHQGVVDLTFYHNGKTITHYEQTQVEGEDEPCWQITEVIPWSSIELNKDKNYLVFNKLLEEEAGSMAYQKGDGYWCPSTKIDNQSKIDFYSQLKKKFNYLATGVFYSTQGINISEFKIIAKQQSSRKKDDTENHQSVLTYKKIDLDDLRSDVPAVVNGKLLDVDDALSSYFIAQENSEEWERFCNEYKIKILPEYQKVLIEMGIKNWVRQSIANDSIGLPITPQSFSEKRFFVIYVRSPKKKEAKAVAVEFLYKEGCIYIKNIMRDLKQIKAEFKFLRTRKNTEDLINGQQYFVDESKQVYISCYISDLFTPTLIGRNGILEELENKTLKINRAIQDDSKLLPLVSYYNFAIKPFKRIQKMICFDLHNEKFIQYYVPPAQSLEQKIKRGFRVYHLIGKTASGESIPTSELLELPITALHFSTLTQNILKISDNSQSSLLQKVAKVLIEN